MASFSEKSQKTPSGSPPDPNSVQQLDFAPKSPFVVRLSCTNFWAHRPTLTFSNKKVLTFGHNVQAPPPSAKSWLRAYNSIYFFTQVQFLKT